MKKHRLKHIVTMVLLAGMVMSQAFHAESASAAGRTKSIGDVIAGKMKADRYAKEGTLTKENCSYFGVKRKGDIVIPKKIRRIGSRTFFSCNKITSVKIPKGVKEIGSGAFECCGHLKKVTMANSVKIIDNYAFTGCIRMTSINISGKTETIGMYAFQGCRSLRSIKIPKSVEYICDGAFDDCPKLKKIIWHGHTFKSVDQFMTVFEAEQE